MRQWIGGDGVRSASAVGGAFVLVLAMGTLGWAVLRPQVPGPAAVFLPPVGTASATPSSTPTLAPPSPTPTPTPTATSRRTSAAVPKPTQAPPPAERPPAPAPPPAPPPDCPTKNGTDAPLPEVRDALVAAGANQVWPGARQPSGLVNPLPPIAIPANLMKAIAWQESGWQSTILACDGGIGTMQLMPGTVSQVNNRFGENFDVNTLSGNTRLGSAYLQWLTVYFGQWYFGERYDLLNTTAPIGTNGETMRLLDVVVAAYNVGPGNVEDLHGTETGADDTLSIPNQRYVDNVTALMTNCVCLTY
jgi:soluble lytic murein transglycosylase-like protein